LPTYPRPPDYQNGGFSLLWQGCYRSGEQWHATGITGRLPGGGKLPKDATVDKGKFDGLLRAMLSTPPIPKSELAVRKHKKRKARKSGGK